MVYMHTGGCRFIVELPLVHHYPNNMKISKLCSETQKWIVSFWKNIGHLNKQIYQWHITVQVIGFDEKKNHAECQQNNR